MVGVEEGLFIQLVFKKKKKEEEEKQSGRLVLFCRFYCFDYEFIGC